jgi:hypothetical protein
MTADAVEDLDPIVPDEKIRTVAGIPVRVKRVRAREVFALSRIVGAGLGSSAAKIDLDVEDKKQMTAEIIGVLLFAIPEAVEETLDFFRKIVEPVKGDKVTERKLAGSFDNPDFGELIDVLHVVLEQEVDTFWDIVGKVRSMAAVASRLMDRKPPEDG